MALDWLQQARKRVAIAPSILAADAGALAAEVRAVAQAGADWLHVDIMDGHFVPNISIGPHVVEALHKACPSLPLDVHLMLQEPQSSLKRYIDAGAAAITVHAEACADLPATLAYIRTHNVAAGLSLKPSTSVDSVLSVLPDIDLLLVMSVEPGFGGQSFKPEVLPKITALHRHRQSLGANFVIQVDGGIHTGTIGQARQAGADAFVAGSAIFGHPPYPQQLAALRNAANAARA